MKKPYHKPEIITKYIAEKENKIMRCMEYAADGETLDRKRDSFFFIPKNAGGKNMKVKQLYDIEFNNKITAKHTVISGLTEEQMEEEKNTLENSTYAKNIEVIAR